ncbi:hypothetical protein M427DRAFT_35384 [Gonapodya prolifera JEL478]|uniref:Uncharacterized protein n=1 Tax=Gonapodya prolifera (strain JEL478) TaxID=1344416 RepID=A0A139A4T0_GONPJ|nr:hypothetical protein M427DRAFT_35384 [Gonapodya prolifera JEL478]|eukprot:KXS11806.1 hypothetical protein M427DRAFT_35384 [Gonapodya prolifera JEL478]
MRARATLIPLLAALFACFGPLAVSAEWHDGYNGKRLHSGYRSCKLPSEFHQYCLDGGWSIQNGYVVSTVVMHKSGHFCPRFKLPNTAVQTQSGGAMFKGKFAPDVEQGGFDGTVKITGNQVTITFTKGNKSCTVQLAVS